MKNILKQHDLKKISPGLFLVIISNLGWIGALTIPFINFLSAQTRAILITIVIIAGQVLFYLGLALLGKKLAKRLKKKIVLPIWLTRKIKYLGHNRKKIKNHK